MMWVMAEAEGGPGTGGIAGLDTSVAHPARVYDYWLGGKDNFAADREAAERVLAVAPGLRYRVRANRAFLGRATRYLAAEAGLRQFLDIGTGIPAAGNTHEVAQRVAPDARVVYVDNDPIVLLHAQALLRSTPEGATDYLQADLRDPGTILDRAAALLDFGQPVAVMLLGVLHLIQDDEDPWGIVARLMAAMPPGSYLTISHPAIDIHQSQANAQRVYNERVATPQTLRTREQVARFFAGLELVDPGLVQVHQWRPDPGDFAPEERVLAVAPGLRYRVRANRAFLGRATRYLAAEAGLRQFLDIGTGIPAGGNTHEVAQRVAPDTRVVYVDNDPIVLLHAQALLRSTPEGATDYMQADLRDPGTILARGAALLDFGQPVAVMLLGVLHLIQDAEDPWGIVARLMAAMPAGSYLTISHPAIDIHQSQANAQRVYNERVATPQTLRTREQVARFFAGLELVDPGLVQVHQWRPDPGDFAPEGTVSAHGAVARKPGT